MCFYTAGLWFERWPWGGLYDRSLSPRLGKRPASRRGGDRPLRRKVSAGAGEGLGDVMESLAAALAGSGEQRERGRRCDLIALHQDSFRLPDNIPGAERGGELLDMTGAGDRQCGMRGERQPDLLGEIVEGSRLAGIQVQRPQRVLRHVEP